MSQGVTQAQFDAAIRKLPNGERRRRRLVTDLAMSEFVRYNCVEVTEVKMTSWVLTGGFALRHCYGASRLSLDVDLTTDPDMRIYGAGSEDLRRPVGFDVDLAGTRLAEKSQKVRYLFKRLYGAGSFTVDLNVDRPLDNPPALRRPFKSLLLPSFDVLVASLEDLVADKVAGFLRFRHRGEVPRSRDMYDQNFVFDSEQEFGVEVVRELLCADPHVGSLFDPTGAKRASDVIAGLLDAEALDRYRRDWAQSLADLIEEEEVPEFDAEYVRYLGHLRRLAL